MIYRVRHSTAYQYTEPADACHNLARLRPRSTDAQTCIEANVRIVPHPSTLRAYVDFFGNVVDSFAIHRPHDALTITLECLVDIHTVRRLPLPASPPWEEVRQRLRGERAPETVDAFQYAFDSPYVRTDDALRLLAEESFTKARPLWEAAFDLTCRIERDFAYDPEATTIDTSLADVLARRRGVCQDFAHLQIGCLRSLGLACRYVSGYLSTNAVPGQSRLVGADATHAWVSVYCPGAGWIDLDPTNGCVVAERHVTIGWGRDYHDVSPVKGVVLGGGQATLGIAVDVAPNEGVYRQ